MAYINLIITAFLCFASSMAYAYDPSKCSTDANGKIYIILKSGLGMAFDPAELLSTREILNKQSSEIKEKDELGCPNNPIITSALNFNPLYKISESSYAGVSSLINDSHRVSIFGHNGPLIVLALDFLGYKDCKKHNSPMIFHDDKKIEICETTYNKLYKINNRIYDNAIIKSKVFEIFSKRNFLDSSLPIPFVISCRRIKKYISMTCFARRTYADGISYSYEYDDKDVDIESILKFDVLIKQKIESNRYRSLDRYTP